MFIKKFELPTYKKYCEHVPIFDILILLCNLYTFKSFTEYTEYLVRININQKIISKVYE